MNATVTEVPNPTPAETTLDEPHRDDVKSPSSQPLQAATPAKRGGWGVLFLIAALHAGVALVLACKLNVWVDEAFSLNTTAGSFADTWRRTMQFELQPPVYFLSLHAWRMVSESFVWARSFSLCCTTLATVLVGRAAAKYFPNSNPAWLAALFAFHPFTLWAAVEVRCYALLLLWSAAAFYLLYQAFLRPDASRRAWWGYIAISLAGLYTQYYFGFVLVANAALLIGYGNWKAVRSYLTAMNIVAIGLIPAIPMIVGHMQQHSSNAPREASVVLPAVRDVYWKAQFYLLPIANNVPGRDQLMAGRDWLTRALVVLGMIALAWRASRTALLKWLLPLGVTAAFFLGVRMWMGEQLLAQRHTAVMFLPTLVAVYALIGLVRTSRWRNLALSAVIAAYVLIAIGNYIGLEKHGSWERVASYLQAHERPEEPIFVFLNDRVLPLSHHYQGVNQMVPLPGPPSVDRYNLQARVLPPEQELADSIREELKQSRFFWLVTVATRPHLGIDAHPEYLEGFVEQHCEVLSTEQIGSTKVRHCVLKR